MITCDLRVSKLFVLPQTLAFYVQNYASYNGLGYNDKYLLDRDIARTIGIPMVSISYLTNPIASIKGNTGVQKIRTIRETYIIFLSI